MTAGQHIHTLISILAETGSLPVDVPVPLLAFYTGTDYFGSEYIAWPLISVGDTVTVDSGDCVAVWAAGAITAKAVIRGAYAWALREMAAQLERVMEVAS